MPAPIYFWPFTDRRYKIQYTWGGHGETSARVALHFNAPTITQVHAGPGTGEIDPGRPIHYRYLWKMEKQAIDGKTSTFVDYRTADHRIYVLGHCKSGQYHLSTGSGADEISQCTFDKLAELFENHGLPKDSHVHIRIHACEGASFAKALHDCMREAGYFAITARGYDVPITNYFIRRWGTNSFFDGKTHYRDFDDPPRLIKVEAASSQTPRSNHEASISTPRRGFDTL